LYATFIWGIPQSPEPITPRLFCYKSTSAGVIPVVTTATEALSEMKAKEAPCNVEAVFHTHYPRVVRIIARVVRDSGRAEELAVEVFLKLWRNQKAQVDQVDNVAAWLYRVAVRAAVDELRRRKRRAQYENLFGFLQKGSSPATPEQIHRATEEQEKVRSILSRMEPRQAEFLLLRSQGFSYQELAAILNLNAASVGVLLHRAQQSFRKEYTKQYGQQ
jgi:RNA polymerase sigma factor (sigma-70 family)